MAQEYMRFMLDLAIPVATWNSFKEWQRSKIYNDISDIKARARTMSKGKSTQEQTIKATYHVCRHEFDSTPCIEEDIIENKLSAIEVIDKIISESISSVPRADFAGEGRNDATIATANNKIYLGLGSVSVTVIVRKRDWWEYDPNTNLWNQKSNFPGAARFGAFAVSCNDRIYLGFGDTGNLQKDWWEYNSATDIWVQKLDFPGTARYFPFGSVVNGKVYVGTGYTIGGRERDWWEYDPTSNTWTQKSDFPGTARTVGVATSMNEKIYCGLGNDGIKRRDWWEYDVLSDSWIQKADFGGTGRDTAICVSLFDKIYVGTGIDTSLLSRKDFWQYDPNTNIWKQMKDFDGIQRNAAAGIVVNNSFYLGLGDLSNNSTFKSNDWWLHVFRSI